MQSLKDIKEMKPTTIYPGHGILSVLYLNKLHALAQHDKYEWVILIFLL